MDQEKSGYGVSLVSGEASTPSAPDANQDQQTKDTATASQREQRGSQRRRVLKGAEIILNQHMGNIPCQIRNVSDTGLSLEIGRQYLVPDRFKLIIPMDGYSVPCEKVHSANGYYGVRFVGEKSPLEKSERAALQPTIVPYLDAHATGEKPRAVEQPTGDTNADQKSALRTRSGFGKRGQ